LGDLMCLSPFYWAF
jgi:hypothetical protein